MIYTLTLNPALDYVLYIDNLTKGQVHHSTKEEIFWGGKGINVSTMLKELSVPSVALGFIAGFTGEALEKGLVDNGINTEFIKINKGLTRINVKIKGREETDIDNYGPEIDGTSLNNLYRKLQMLQDGDVFIIAGSVPNSLPQNIYKEIIKKFANKNIELVVDAKGEALLSTLEYKPFLIKPNSFELNEALGTNYNSIEGFLTGGRILQEMGARNVLISLADKGAVLVDENGKEYYMEAPKGETLNSVGAGDSMLAGFLCGYLETKDYYYSLKLGTACGSATAHSVGLGKLDKIQSLMQMI